MFDHRSPSPLHFVLSGFLGDGHQTAVGMQGDVVLSVKPFPEILF